MAAEKVTPMVIKVDLQCPCCYKKIKKTLCKFPQIRDQVYDEKANTVTVTVVCCSPEKIKDKLCSKAGKVIKGIEIKEPAKPKGPEKKEPEKTGKDKVVVIEKPKEGAKPQDKPKEGEKPKDKPKEGEKPKPKGDGAPPAVAAKALESVPANGVPSVFPLYGPTYDAYAAGPYYHGYGFPPPPSQPYYEGYYGYGYNQHGYGHAHGSGNGYGPYGYGYGRGGNVTGSNAYFSEENPQTCSIM